MPFTHVYQAHHKLRGSVFGHVVQQAFKEHLGFIKLPLTIARYTLALHTRHWQAHHLNRLMHDLRIRSRDQRRQKVRVTPPAFTRRLIDRLTHLPDTGCLDRPVQFRGIEHLRFPLHPHIIQHTTRLSLRLRDHVLIAHLENVTRKQLVPVVHHQVVVGQLFTDPLQVIGKAHPTVSGRVVSKVVGDSDIARITSH